MTSLLPTPPEVDLGSCYATARAIALFSSETLLGCLARHAAGDWGDLDTEDREANDVALATGGRLLSSYVFPDRGKLWVITEHDRSATTLLLPEDY